MTRKELENLLPGMDLLFKANLSLDPFEEGAYQTFSCTKIVTKCDTVDGNFKVAFQFKTGIITKTVTTYPGDTRVLSKR
jgi:hypothetical protein